MLMSTVIPFARLLDGTKIGENHNGKPLEEVIPVTPGQQVTLPKATGSGQYALSTTVQLVCVGSGITPVNGDDETLVTFDPGTIVLVTRTTMGVKTITAYVCE